MYSMQRAGVPVTPHTAMQVDSVFTCLRVISNAIVKMGNPRAYTLGLDKDNRPYKKWLAKQPSILTNTFGDVWQYDGATRTVISLGLYGEAFWYILTRDYLGFPSAIEVLNPAFMEMKNDQGTTRYFYGSGVSKKQLNPDDLIHVPFIAMPGAQRGLSSIEFAGVSYALALAAMEYGQRWFSQGASPSFVLETEQKLGQEEVERIAQKFLIQHSGLQSSHLPLVLDMGMKASKVGSNPDEAQFIGTLDYARMAIGAWFGLPPHLIGVMNDKPNIWGKTVQEMGYQLQDYTFSGYTCRLNEAYSSMLPRGTFAWLDESVIQRANAVDTAHIITAERQATVLTPNESRAIHYQLPPVKGGDDILSPLASNAAVAVDPEPGILPPQAPAPMDGSDLGDA